MSRQHYIFQKFLLLFLFIVASTHAGRKAVGSNFKFPIKKSASYKTKSNDLKKLSDDEISLALSDLSVNDLRALNNLLTKRIPIDCSYPSNCDNNGNGDLKRLVRESKRSKVKSLVQAEKFTKSPNQKIREEIQKLRENVEKQFRSKLVRKKREDMGEDWRSKNSKYYINSPSIEEYIKLLEGSFPNIANSQAENEGSHVRVKRQ